MSNKFTIDTIKDLKAKIKDSKDNLINYYTRNEFKPDNWISLSIEQSDMPIIDESIVDQMLVNLTENNEFEAGKLLFENLKLSPKQASDIGYWTYHNHYTFYRYIAQRWGDIWQKENQFDNPSSYIINHWIQSNSSQGELIDYPISGLWWSFFISVDESKSDKYALTKVFFQNLSLRTKLLGAARVGRHKPAILAILEFINEHKIPLEEATRAIVPYINLLGGIRPLSYFGKDWFKTKLTNRFGKQISDGKKIFIRPDKIKITNTNIKSTTIPVKDEKPNNFDYYLCINANTGNYMISSTFKSDWDYCIGLDYKVQNQFLLHFYKEGKIKKTKINGNLYNKTVDRAKPYSNGKCQRLTLLDIKLINKPVLLGIAYKTHQGIFFKAMDEQNTINFRNDNSEMNQEGKKVLYIDTQFQVAYKVLPHELTTVLSTLVQHSPTSKGAEITNRYHLDKWNILKNYWPELFNNSINWL